MHDSLEQAGTESRSVVSVKSPINGEVVATVPHASVQEVAVSAEQLRRAQPEWEDLGPRGRSKVLVRYAEWILDNQNHILDVLQSETGKVRQDATFEPASTVDLIRYYARHAKKFMADQHPRPHGIFTATKSLTIRWRPYQLVGHISPWNFPFFIPIGDSVPALLAGAAVLLKPSEITPLAAVEAGRGWEEIGAPDVFRVVTGAGDTGSAVVNNVDYVQFTGSTPTGRAIAQRAGERLIPCSLELGGKDPMIVLNDADIDRAVNAAVWGGLFNSGQVCTSVERIYAEAGIYNEFVAELTQRVGNLRQGADAVAGVKEVGAMATPAQVQLVEQQVADAVVNGAKVLVGGGVPASESTQRGNWFQPTIIVDVEQDMRLMQEETFGPTLPVKMVASAAEAVELANDSQYGLSASVWTKNRARGEAIATQIKAGAVNINDMYANISALPIPMSGWASSGLGARFGGADGLLKYCRSQAITRARLAPSNEPLWYPYSEAKSRRTARLVRFAVARGTRRLRAGTLRGDRK